MGKMLPEQLYRKIQQIIPNLEQLEPGEAVKLKSEGFMDLNVDILSRDGDTVVIAMSHYYKHPSGDMIPDPDMEIAIYPKIKMAEALSYQDSFGYRQVYPDFPEKNRYYPKAKQELNSFLNTWLRNLKMQGHQVEGEGRGLSK